MQRNMFNKTELALENPLASLTVNYVKYFNTELGKGRVKSQTGPDAVTLSVLDLFKNSYLIMR